MQSPKSVYVIAELCSNAAPFDDARLIQFCRAAKDAGADAVKAQLLPTPNHFPGPEQETKQRTMCPTIRLAALRSIAVASGLQWGFSVFSIASLGNILHAWLEPNFLKLASREYHNTHLARAVIATDIWCLRSIPLGASPRKPDGQRRLEDETLLACDDRYPAPDVPDGYFNGRFGEDGEPDGWSSHTRGWEDVIAAVRAGATVIEKHLKLSDEDPEAEWSLNPQQFAEMVKQIREAEG